MFKFILLFFTLASSSIHCAENASELLVENITNIQNATSVEKHSQGDGVQYSGSLPNGQIVTSCRYNHSNAPVYRCILEKSAKIIEISKDPKKDFDILAKKFADTSTFAKLFAPIR